MEGRRADEGQGCFAASSCLRQATPAVSSVSTPSPNELDWQDNAVKPSRPVKPFKPSTTLQNDQKRQMPCKLQQVVRRQKQHKSDSGQIGTDTCGLGIKLRRPAPAMAPKPPVSNFQIRFQNLDLDTSR